MICTALLRLQLLPVERCLLILAFIVAATCNAEVRSSVNEPAVSKIQCPVTPHASAREQGPSLLQRQPMVSATKSARAIEAPTQAATAPLPMEVPADHQPRPAPASNKEPTAAAAQPLQMAQVVAPVLPEAKNSSMVSALPHSANNLSMLSSNQTLHEAQQGWRSRRAFGFGLADVAMAGLAGLVMFLFLVLADII
mmetsp:Transcript_2587/g.4773  ORF Transcript_2587/g.4773 Transcript_2587/m.4773 type:complete len:196 (-) Transcript_2587:73-660(-)